MSRYCLNWSTMFILNHVRFVSLTLLLYTLVLSLILPPSLVKVKEEVISSDECLTTRTGVDNLNNNLICKPTLTRLGLRPHTPSSITTWHPAPAWHTASYSLPFLHLRSFPWEWNSWHTTRTEVLPSNWKGLP